jgi:hypothetical protein
MSPLKPICAQKNVRRDGTSLIFIQYCFNSEKRTNLNTGIAVPPAFWNKTMLSISKDLPAVYGNHKDLNSEVKRMLRLAEDIIDFAEQKNIVNRVKFVKETFSPSFDLNSFGDEEKMKALMEKQTGQVNPDLFYQIDDYIKSKEKRVTPATLGVFRQMKEHLRSFEASRNLPITFESFDYIFYQAFIDFLTFDYEHKRRKQILKGLKINTVGKTIKHLRIFIKDRSRRKIIAPIDMSDFRILEEEADAIYLTEKEIAQIQQTDLSEHRHLIKYRDLLVFGCLTGLRFSDFSSIKADDIRGNKLYKKQEKSEHWVVIPLKDLPYHILIHNFKKEIPQIKNADFNYYIKEVGRLAGVNENITFSYKKGNRPIIETRPKYAWITSHTCRRSFCTNEFLAGTPVLLIMKISGHKKERDFYRYIRISAEQAAQQIEIIWKERASTCILR